MRTRRSRAPPETLTSWGRGGVPLPLMALRMTPRELSRRPSVPRGDQSLDASAGEANPLLELGELVHLAERQQVAPQRERGRARAFGRRAQHRGILGRLGQREPRGGLLNQVRKRGRARGIPGAQHAGQGALAQGRARRGSRPCPESRAPARTRSRRRRRACPRARSSPTIPISAGKGPPPAASPSAVSPRRISTSGSGVLASRSRSEARSKRAAASRRCASVLARARPTVTSSRVPPASDAKTTTTSRAIQPPVTLR